MKQGIKGKEKFKNSKILQIGVLLLASGIIFLSGHKHVFLYGYFKPDAWLDLAFIIVMLSFNWWLFRYRIFKFLFRLSVKNIDSKKKYFLIGFLAHFGFITALTYLFLFIVYQKHIISFIMNEFSAAFFLIGSWYLWGYVSKQDVKNTDIAKNKLEVQSGNKIFFIEYQSITSVKMEDLHAIIFLDSGQKYAVRKSLDNIMEDLPSNLFFRANRQLILSKNVINGFKKIENRKIEIQYQSQEQKEIAVVSRYKAAEFKTWLNGAGTIQDKIVYHSDTNTEKS